MNEQKYKILVIAPIWVGDLVMSQTLFIHLHDKYNGKLQLDVFASDVTKNLVMRMPQVNQVIINPFKHGTLAIWQRIFLGIKLRKNNYDEVIILPNTIKSAITPFFAGIKKRTGFVGEGRYGLINNIYKLDSQQLPRMVDRYCALGNNGVTPEQIKYPSLFVDKANQEVLRTKFKIDSASQVIAFCPAAEYGIAKRWFPEYFAQLADLLIAKSYQIVLLGGAKDIELGEKIVQLTTQNDKVLNLCGQTSLTDVVDLIAEVNCVVTNDTGLMHIASAVSAKVIVLYGSSSPKYTPPLCDTAKILKVSLECSPCFKRTCRFGHYNCLRFISPEEVYTLCL